MTILINLLSALCFASQVQDTLVSVEHQTVRFSVPLRFETIYGSGICINQKCSVIATAYHIQLAAGKGNLAVTGGHTRKVLSLANDSDSNKTDVRAGRRMFSYNLANDVSFVYTKKPIPHKSGISYSHLYHVGQRVQIAGFYHGKLVTQEAHLIGADALLQMGTAQLRENLILDVGVKQGYSGSAVLDEQGRLLGMIILTGAIPSNSGNTRASVALPVRTIAKALLKLDPSLADSIFGTIPEAEQPSTAQMSFAVEDDSASPEEPSAVFPELAAAASDVQDPVAKLRAKAAVSAGLLVNFLAKQCVTEGVEKPVCHEVGVVEGQQIYRRIRRNHKLGEPVTTIPNANHSVWTGAEWFYTLTEIAENPWVFQGLFKDQYLFSFMSSAEDDRCSYEERPGGAIPLFRNGHLPWQGSVACFEQILTDKAFNVLSVFTDWRPPEACLTQFFQTAIYFDWIELEGVNSPVPFPAREQIVAKFRGQERLRFSNVTWTEYRQYRVSHKITARIKSRQANSSRGRQQNPVESDTAPPPAEIISAAAAKDIHHRLSSAYGLVSDLEDPVRALRACRPETSAGHWPQDSGYEQVRWKKSAQELQDKDKRPSGLTAPTFQTGCKPLPYSMVHFSIFARSA
ncbi:MAG: trypsin-like peptidase domain-containing protein [Terriglobales bacterium]